jgi:hypothetical protein
MPNTSKATLCRAIVDCVHQTHCAKSFNFTDCFCGEGANADECFAMPYEMAHGACKELIAAGAESSMTQVIAANLSDLTFAIGRADSVIESCDFLTCTQCL